MQAMAKESNSRDLFQSTRQLRSLTTSMSKVKAKLDPEVAQFEVALLRSLKKFRAQFMWRL